MRFLWSCIATIPCLLGSAPRTCGAGVGLVEPIQVSSDFSLGLTGVSPRLVTAGSLRYEHLVGSAVPGGDPESFGLGVVATGRYAALGGELQMSLPALAYINGPSAPEQKADIGSLSVMAKWGAGRWGGQAWEVQLAPALRLTLPTRGFIPGQPVYWAAEPILSLGIRDDDLSLVVNQAFVFLLDTESSSEPDQDIDWAMSLVCSYEIGRVAPQLGLQTQVRAREDLILPGQSGSPSRVYAIGGLVVQPLAETPIIVELGARVSLSRDARDYRLVVGSVSLRYELEAR